MPYLSRIWLNPLRTGAQRLLRSPHAVHAAVLGGLPEQPVTERVLWRMDTPTPHRAELLVLTHTRPSWAHLVESAGWPDASKGDALVKDYDPFLSRIAAGQTYAFRLRANTVSATQRPAAPSASQRARMQSQQRHRGVIVPHRTAAHQQQWFLDRVTGWGFEFVQRSDGGVQASLIDRGRNVFTKGPAGKRSRVALTTATIQGAVRIADADQVRSALTSGVGRARAYGCGLITLAPISSDWVPGGDEQVARIGD